MQCYFFSVFWFDVTWLWHVIMKLSKNRIFSSFMKNMDQLLFSSNASQRHLPIPFHFFLLHPPPPPPPHFPFPLPPCKSKSDNGCATDQAPIMEATIPGNQETRHAYKLGLLSRPQNSIEVEISGNDYENVATIQNVSSSLTSFSDSVINSLSSTELRSEALKFQDDPTQLLFIIDHTKIPRSAPLTQLDTCRRAPLRLANEAGG